MCFREELREIVERYDGRLLFEYDIDGGGLRRPLLENQEILDLIAKLKELFDGKIGAAYRSSGLQALSNGNDAKEPLSVLVRFAQQNQHEKDHHIQFLGCALGATVHYLRNVILHETITFGIYDWDPNTSASSLVSFSKDNGREAYQMFFEASQDYANFFDPSAAIDPESEKRTFAIKGDVFESDLSELCVAFPKLKSFISNEGVIPTYKGTKFSGFHLFEALAPFGEYWFLRSFEKEFQSFDAMENLYGSAFKNGAYGLAWEIYKFFGGPEQQRYAHVSEPTQLHRIVPQAGFLWALQMALNAPLFPWRYAPENCDKALYPDFRSATLIEEEQYEKSSWEAIHPGWRFIHLCAAMEQAGWDEIYADCPTDPYSSEQGERYGQFLLNKGEEVAENLGWVSPRGTPGHWAIQRDDEGNLHDALHQFWPEDTKVWQRDLLAASAAYGVDVILGRELPIEISHGSRMPTEKCLMNYHENGGTVYMAIEKSVDPDLADLLRHLRFIIEWIGYGHKPSAARRENIVSVIETLREIQAEQA